MMELGLTAADALAHLFGLFKATPTGKRVIEGALKTVDLDVVAVAIRATAAGDGNLETALKTWAADPAFEALLASQNTDAAFEAAVERFRFIAGNTAGPGARETADETVRSFCTHWKRGLLGEAGYVKDQLDEARDRGRQKQDDASLQKILDQFGKLGELIKTQTTLPAGPGASASQKVNDRLAEARDIIDRDPKRAREICRDLRKYETLTADDSFRVTTNIGVASMRLGDLATAEVELSQALELQPKNPRALYNAAGLALRMEKFDDALELAQRAFEIAPTDGMVLVNYLDALRLTGNLIRLAELLPQPDAWPADTPLAAAAMLYVALDRFDDAEAVARRAEEAAPDNPVVLDLLAVIFLVPRRGLLNVDAEPQAREAERLLDHAVDLAQTWETKAPLASSLLHRARARSLLGKFIEAFADCSAAEASGGDVREVRQIEGLIHLELRDFDAATRAFDEIGDGSKTPEIVFSLAVIALNQGAASRAVELLEPFLEDDPASITFRGAADLLLSAYKAANRDADVVALSVRLEALVPAVPGLAPLLAQQKFHSGESEAALALLDDAARATADPEERAFIQLHAANLLAGQKRFAEAVTKYDDVLAFAPDRDAAQRRVFALYDAGDVAAALAAARELRADGPAIPHVSELEAQILWQTRDSVEAEKVLRLLAARESHRKIHILRAIKARADYDREGATAEASALAIDEFTDADELFEAAALRERLNLANALDWYYRAISLAPSDSDVILGFLGAYSRRMGANEAKDPDEVTTDCAVTLRRGDDKRVIVIAPMRDSVVRAEFFASESPFAKRLLGRREGDEVALTDEEEARGRRYTVEIITSRYALAWSQLVIAFPLHFPESKVITTGEGEAEIVAKVEQQFAFHAHVMALYENRLISLNAVADMLAMSAPQAWGTVAGDSGRPLRAALGSSDEAVMEDAAIAQQSAVIDLTAAMTLDYLGLSEVAFGAFKRILVPRRVIDELEQLLLNEFSSDSESLALGKENDRYVARERTTEERRAGRETIERVRSVLQKHGDVMPHASLTELGRDEIEKLLRRLGETSLATLLVARQANAAIVADDIVTRIVGKTKWELASIGTQNLVLHLRACGSISNEQYWEALVQLADIQYRFLRTGAADLFAVLKRANFALTRPVQRLFASLEGPECDDEGSAQIVAEVLDRLYDEIILPPNIAVVVEFLCQALAAGRSASASMGRLKLLASIRLRGRPFARAEVVDACDRIGSLGSVESVRT